MQNFKILKYTFTLVGLFIFGIFNYLFANSEYYYKNLTVNADIQQDGTIQVNEVFDAYFNVYKHGIIRDIPLKYTIDGKKFRIFLENIRVEGRNSSVYDSYGEKEIKIGDADRELIGDQRYSIHYSVYGLIRNFAGKGREELSWNIIPNGFDTHIDHVRIELKLPKSYTGFTSEDFLVAADGKSNKLEDFEGTIDWSQGNKIILTYDKTIPAGNGITLAVKFPVGYFTFDHERQESLIDTTKDFVIDFGSSFSINTSETFDLYGLIGIFLSWGCFVNFYFVYLINIWKQRRHVKKAIQQTNSKYPVFVQYSVPVGLNSAEVGLLYNEKPTFRHLASLLYEWCSKKLVTMHVSRFLRRKTLTLTKINECFMKEYERKFFDNFFTSNMVTLSNDQSFYHIFKDAKANLSTYGYWQGWFSDFAYYSYDNYSPVRLIGHKNKMLPILLLIVGGLLSCYFTSWFDEEGVFIALIPWLFVFVFGYIPLVLLDRGNYLPKLTEQGIKLKNHILGFKMFLETCDVPMLKKFLQQDPLYFDKILPYAVALGMETIFIKKIKPLLQDKRFETTFVLNDVDVISDKVDSIKAPRSFGSVSYDRDSGFSSGSSGDSGSSSGRSGGGGGGGGGRSW